MRTIMRLKFIESFFCVLVIKEDRLFLLKVKIPLHISFTGDLDHLVRLLKQPRDFPNCSRIRLHFTCQPAFSGNFPLTLAFC